jgi:DNA-binding CsgD family transcriptional regulator
LRLGETVQNYDLETRDRAGRSIWVNLSTLAVPGSEPELRLTVHFFRDVGAAHQLQSLVAKSLAGRRTSDPAPLQASNLTRREVEILRLLSHGLGTAAIAVQLGVCVVTTRNHVQHILAKLGIHSRLEAVAWAWEHGLLEPEASLGTHG